VNYIRRGTGKPLLLGHGLGGSWRSWLSILDPLAAARDVIAVDLPGFSDTPPLQGEVSIATLADVDMEVGLDPNGNRELGALAYWTVSDIAASVKALVAAGGTVVKDITDVGYGMLVANVKDPNGAAVGLRQPPKG